MPSVIKKDLATICITFRRINHGSQPPEKSEYFHPFCSLALLLALSLSSSSMCLSITSESESRSVVSSSLWPHGLHSPWNSPCQNTGVGSLSLLQGIFQGLNPDLLHCRQILYQPIHKERLRILEWVAYPFSSGSSWPRNRIGVSCIAGRFFYQLNYWGKGMATHSSILAWWIPWTEKPGRLQSTGHKKSGMPEQITHMSKMNTNHGGL